MARKLGVTAGQVVDAAVAVADERGLAELTPSVVAAALGIQTPSLYAHVAGAGGLRQVVARRANELLAAALAEAAGADAEPLARLRAICHGYRRYAHAHPGLYAALLPTPDPADDPDGAAAAAAALGVITGPLTELAIDADVHVDLVRTLRAHLHGFVDLELREGFGLADPVDDSFGFGVDLLLQAAVAAGRRA